MSWERTSAEGNKEGWLLSSEQVELGKVLGKGSFGEVFLGMLANKQVAVKNVRIRGQSEAKSFGRANSALSKLRDTNVITFYGAVVEPPKAFWQVIEYLPGGTLANWLRGERRTVSERLNMAIGIAKGMQAAHASTPPILHRDLKPSNVMLTAQHTPKVIDFGLCREFLEAEADTLTSKTGSYLYMSPEMMRREETGETYALSTDVFSYGILLNEIMCQKTPYEEMRLEPAQVAKAVAYDDLRPHLAPHLPLELATLVKACWSGDPAERPTFATVVQQLQGILQAIPAEHHHHHHLFHLHH